MARLLVILIVSLSILTACSSGEPTPTPIAKPLKPTTPTNAVCKESELTNELELKQYQGTDPDFHGLRFLYPQNWKITADDGSIVITRDKDCFTPGVQSFTDLDDTIFIYRYYVGFRAGANANFRTLEEWV